MHNSDEYEYDEYEYIIEAGDCDAISVEKLHKAPPNPIAKRITKKEAEEFLKHTTIIAQMSDPGVKDVDIQKERHRNN